MLKEMKMKIVTDCAADLTPEDIEILGITVAPLYISFPEGQVNSDDISRDDFYDRLKAMVPEVPSTAQPAPGVFANIYQKLAELGEEILSIHISSGLSGTMNSARLGSQQVQNNLINLVDSFTLSGGQRFQVLAAAWAIKAGWGKTRILKMLDTIRGATELIYTLETLSYLARGGRIGRVQALAGSLLNLKPIIHVDRKDGKYSTVGKTRTIDRALADMVKLLKNEYNDKPVWVSVMHGQYLEQAQDLAQRLRDNLNVAKLEILRISPVLGVHTGPGIVGAGVVPVESLEGLI
jgi:DegV family protein with EDD domain